MSVALFAHLKVRLDDTGNLLITQEAAGTPGPLKALGETKGSSTSSGYLQTAEQTIGTPSTTSHPFLNARAKVNDGPNHLCVAFEAVGATPGPATVVGNLKVKTDEHGSVICALRAAGTPDPGGPRALANTKLKLDEGGRLLVAVGP